jgi:hypothetical protein
VSRAAKRSKLSTVDLIICAGAEKHTYFIRFFRPKFPLLSAGCSAKTASAKNIPGEWFDSEKRSPFSFAFTVQTDSAKTSPTAYSSAIATVTRAGGIMMRRVFIQFIIVTFLLTGAAAAQKNRAVEPCKLLTKIDAEKIVGKNFEFKKKTIEGFESSCLYRSVDDKSEVEIDMQVYESRKKAREAELLFRQLTLQYGEIEPVNIGEKAFIWLTYPHRTTLNVRKNNVNFEIHVFAEAYSNSELKRVARRIATQLRAN